MSCVLQTERGPGLTSRGKEGEQRHCAWLEAAWSRREFGKTGIRGQTGNSGTGNSGEFGDRRNIPQFPIPLKHQSSLIPGFLPNGPLLMGTDLVAWQVFR